MTGDLTWWAWAILVAVAVVTFVVWGLWWMSGWQGGNKDETGPVGMTVLVTGVVAAFMWWAGLLP